MQADSLLSESPRKPKNSGMGSLSFLQRIFLTPKMNRGLLHCRQILYWLSSEGSPVGFGGASWELVSWVSEEEEMLGVEP